MSTINPPAKIIIQILRLKDVKEIYQIKSYRAAKNYYNDLLALAGKSKGMKLTNIDIFNIDGITL